jgi:hypothetical protein
VPAAGFGIYGTEMAYINHFGRKTADQFSFYAARAQFRYRYGTWRYWLKDWGLLTTRTTTTHLPPSGPDAVAAPQLSVVDSGRR